MKQSPYFVYMLRCQDDSIYTGITTDLARRMQEHFEKLPSCAKYTLRHDAKKLECAWQTENRTLASKLEWHIKHLCKKEKEELIIRKSMFQKCFATYFAAENFKRLTKQECKKYEKGACTFSKKEIQ